jgi:chaperone BCS1
LMDLSTGTPWETVKVTALSRDRNLFPLLLAEAREQATKGQAGKIVVYTSWGVEWKPFGQPRPKRELGSVVLAHGIAERIENDLKAFLGRGRWYAERGEALFFHVRNCLHLCPIRCPLRDTI